MAAYSAVLLRELSNSRWQSHETFAFLNAFQHFLLSRPKPSPIISDNESNIIGTKQELQQRLNKWNQSTINNYMLQNEIEWTMNQPAASNFGRAIERMIRSTRKIQLTTTKVQCFTDDG